jgi:hypothetical protein
MKNLKFTPLIVIFLYFFLVKIFPNFSFEIKIICAVLLFILSSYIVYEVFQKKHVTKERKIMLWIFVSISILLFLLSFLFV